LDHRVLSGTSTELSLSVVRQHHGVIASAGKLSKVVIVAVMRKMITTLNAMVRDDIAWADRLSGRHSVTTAR
jgi:hypothetical protein